MHQGDASGDDEIGRGQAEQVGEKPRGTLLVVAPDNRVVELHAHTAIVTIAIVFHKGAVTVLPPA
ncbi:MAG: hypothetical protein A2V77_04220 [Anaeromyxobacter sp. RBG_16_69_14]|nr:MAG: hypothetical protein A2V77_04220 [Anaeromyxobacter sp. RBG_16_69_14]